MIRAKTSKIRWWEGEGSDFHLLTGSEWNGPGVNDEEFNHPIPRTSFPKRIRAKTIKYRAPGSSMAMARINSGSAWKVPIVGDKDGARHQEASSMGIIASKTEMEQEDMAQAPLLPSLPEETGMRGIKVSAHLQKRNSYPYSLYLGSFRTTARAERAMAVYRKNGFRPYLTRVEFKERGVWFRVYGGYFKDSVQAESYKEKHHLLEAKVRKTNFANLVGTYSDQKALKDNMSRLESMGYHPYVIKGVDGRSSLFLGAYVTETGAVKQNQDLKSKGISVEVIRR